jgi:RHS repeat-associated protein
MTTGAGTANFTYDGSSRLVSADYPASTGITDQTFGYDALGNRTSTSGAPASSYHYDASNRLLSDPTADFTYDAEGNTLTRTVRATGAKTSYTWSTEHELTATTHPDGTTTTFRYDPFGRRVEINDRGQITRYAFDNDAIAATYNATNTLTATFTRDGTDPTRTLEMTRGGQRYFYLTDAQGSTTALTTITGAVANTYTYDAFGTAVQTGTVDNPLTYTGQTLDPGSGLFLFRLRAYDPAIGRFLSEDPMLSLNPYPYVNNDPLNKIDPTGATATTEQAQLQRDTHKRINALCAYANRVGILYKDALILLEAIRLYNIAAKLTGGFPIPSLPPHLNGDNPLDRHGLHFQCGSFHHVPITG